MDTSFGWVCEQHDGCGSVQEKIIRFVEKVTVLQDGEFEVEFKGGVSVRIDVTDRVEEEKQKMAV